MAGRVVTCHDVAFAIQADFGQLYDRVNSHRLQGLSGIRECVTDLGWGHCDPDFEIDEIECRRLCLELELDIDQVANWMEYAHDQD